MMNYPFLPWNPADFNNSSDVIAMTEGEELLYRRLLDRLWMANPQCYLPDDPEYLCKLVRMRRPEFLKRWSRVSFKFSRSEGMIFNQRQLKDLERCQKVSQRQSDKAKSRWNENDAAALPGHSRGNAPIENREERIDIRKENIHPLPLPSEKKAGIVELESTFANLEIGEINASQCHKVVADVLQSLGYVCQWEFQVPNRGDGRPGRIDIIAQREGEVLAVEIDRVTPRDNSIRKLNQVNAGLRVVLLREPKPGTTNYMIGESIHVLRIGPEREAPNPERDYAFDEFAELWEEKFGMKYDPEQKNFVQLARLRKKLGLTGKAVPEDWSRSLNNFFESPLSVYSLADLCARYHLFRKSALDRFGKIIDDDSKDMGWATSLTKHIQEKGKTR